MLEFLLFPSLSGLFSHYSSNLEVIDCHLQVRKIADACFKSDHQGNEQQNTLLSGNYHHLINIFGRVGGDVGTGCQEREVRETNVAEQL